MPTYRYLLLLLAISICCLSLFTAASSGGEELDPDDFDRMDIDVDELVGYHSQYPKPVGEDHKHSRYAYVLIHYEGTPKDDLYVLGTRAVIRSIKESGSKQDIVIICADNVRPSTIEIFQRDGAIIKPVPNIPNPYKATQQRRRTYKSRFEFTFNKLYVWNLLEYERVIYNDADNLITRNIDELFLCGHYCVTYFNPIFFHTGMMVVKPDHQKFKQLVHDLLSLEIFSYDGADQGFLTAAFTGVENSPLFHPVYELTHNNARPSEEPLMRFPMEYNFNNVYYYTSFSFTPFRNANLPFSYLQYSQKERFGDALTETQLDMSVVSSSSSSKNTTPSSKIKKGTTKQLMPIPEPDDDLDYAIAVGSLDYCIGPLLKPWNWLPYIYFHTVRFWAPIRMRIEADDLQLGIIPPSRAMFGESLINGVLPLLSIPILFYIVTRIPQTDIIRKFCRFGVRLIGVETIATTGAILAFFFSLYHVSNTIPLETRPELAWISAMLIIILSQFNMTFILSILCSPPCPDVIREDSHQLDALGINPTHCYGITFDQISQLFGSMGMTTFVSHRTASQQYQYNSVPDSIGFPGSGKQFDNRVQDDDDDDLGIELDDLGAPSPIETGGDDIDNDDDHSTPDSYLNLLLTQCDIISSQDGPQYDLLPTDGSSISSSKMVTPTPTTGDAMYQKAYRYTAPHLLSSALSLRGGIYPSALYIHLTIIILSSLFMAKFGSYSDFIHKIAVLCCFIIIYVGFSVFFLAKILHLAMGSIHALGKIYT